MAHTRSRAIEPASLDHPIVDRAPLRSRVRWRDIASMRRRADIRTPRVLRAALRSTLVIATGAFGALIALSTIGLSIILAVESFDSNPAWPSVVLPIAASVLFLRFLGQLVARDVRPTGWRRWVRLVRFAEANRMTYTPERPDPNLPGVIFGDGMARLAYDCLRATASRPFEIGTYQYSVWSMRAGMIRRWGYLAIQLPVELPNMILIRKGRGRRVGRSGLDATLRTNQTLSLEGDFDRYFTLFVPKGYERDALYVFTPDLMALMIDEGADFDAELVDDWLFFYSRRPVNLFSRRQIDRLLSMVEVIGSKMDGRTARYSDDRREASEPGAIGPGGRRLRRAIPITVILVCFHGVLVLWRTTTGIWFW